MDTFQEDFVWTKGRPETQFWSSKAILPKSSAVLYNLTGHDWIIECTKFSPGLLSIAFQLTKKVFIEFSRHVLIDVKISCDLVACESSHSGNRLKLVIYSTTILSLSYLSVLHKYFATLLSWFLVGSYVNKQSFVGFFGGFDGDFILSI